MKKKMLSAILTMAMIAASLSPVYGAEFSSGEEIAAAAEEPVLAEDPFSVGNEAGETASAEQEAVQFEDSSEEDEIFLYAGDDEEFYSAYSSSKSGKR